MIFVVNSPGVVATDMGKYGMDFFGIPIESSGAITPEESAKGLLEVIDKAERDTHGGRFWTNTGEELPF
jgi:hypothetical protein